MAERFVLKNGLRLLVEPLPHLRSIATGIWAEAGSAGETPALSGASHYLEHMMFKGTERRTAQEISEAMDRVGGLMNAYTSKEHTCYYTRCLDEDFELALDLLADIYLHSQLDQVEFDREKNVIIEEINMYEDTPDDLVMDNFAAAIWPTHPYGRPVIGSLATVEALSRSQLQEYWRASYHPAATILTVAGNITPAAALDAAERYFGDLQAPARLQRADYPPAVGAANLSFAHKDIEQTHICLGFEGLAEGSADYFAAYLLCNILGGGMSSRLFQEIREKRGLCYGVYSYLGAYAKGGYFAAYASTRPRNVGELLQVVSAELADLTANGVRAEELQLAKQQVKGSLLLSMENSGNVMSKLGKNELAFGQPYDVQEKLAQVMAVDEAAVRDLARRLFRRDKLVVAMVGPEEYPLDPAKII